MKLTIKEIEPGKYQVRRVYGKDHYQAEGVYTTREAAERKLAELKAGLKRAAKELAY